MPEVGWLPGEPSCPECRVAKHDNCDGGAWDLDNDVPTYCRCAADNHGRSPAGQRRSLDDEIADEGEHWHYLHTRIGGFDE